MLKNPYINAFLAAGYIAVIVSLIQGVATLNKNKPDTILIPITMLSLFVLSAAIMGLLFIYTPAKMFLDNQRETALIFFFKTLGTFACFAFIFTLLLLLS